MNEINSEDLRQAFIWGIILGASVIAIGVLIFVFGASSQKSLNDVKFDKCIDIAVKAVPDPNDTEARNSIMSNCFDTKND